MKWKLLIRKLDELKHFSLCSDYVNSVLTLRAVINIVKYI